MFLRRCSLYRRRVLLVQSHRHMSGSSSKEVEVTQLGGLRIIKLNRPNKLNAFNMELYRGVTEELSSAAQDPSTAITAVTGSGDYFSSGNDLNMFQPIPKTQSELDALALRSRDVLYEFVKAFIDFNKPLVGVVNGPAIGIGGSILGLMDLVYASDRAYLSLPFVRLGQGPEGCSSYIFPRIMGPAKAAEIIYFGRKMDASEGEKLGLFTRVISHQELDSIWGELEEYSRLPKPSLLHCKEVIRGVQRDTLHAVNKKECDMLVDRWSSPETFKAVSKMFLHKKKEEKSEKV